MQNIIDNSRNSHSMCIFPDFQKYSRKNVNKHVIYTVHSIPVILVLAILIKTAPCVIEILFDTAVSRRAMSGGALEFFRGKISPK